MESPDRQVEVKKQKMSMEVNLKGFRDTPDRAKNAHEEFRRIDKILKSGDEDQIKALKEAMKEYEEEYGLHHGTIEQWVKYNKDDVFFNNEYNYYKLSKKERAKIQKDTFLNTEETLKAHYDDADLENFYKNAAPIVQKYDLEFEVGLDPEEYMSREDLGLVDTTSPKDILDATLGRNLEETVKHLIEWFEDQPITDNNRMQEILYYGFARYLGDKYALEFNVIDKLYEKIEFIFGETLREQFIITNPDAVNSEHISVKDKLMTILPHLYEKKLVQGWYY